MSIVISIVAMTALDISTSMAGLYSWKDKNGVTHFSDEPPPEHVMLGDNPRIKEIIKSVSYSVPVFTVSNAMAPDFEFSGDYYPIQPGYNGLPQYKLQKKKSNYSRCTLSATGYEGKWQWVFKKRDKEKYYSGFVKEGTPPSHISVWTNELSRWGKRIPITIKKQKLAFRQGELDYMYFYDPKETPPDLCPWMKNRYQISGIPTSYFNGIYKPVNWNSPLPRYTKGNNVILAVENYRDEWVWKLFSGKDAQFSSDRQEKGSLPHEVTKWYEIRGRLYLPVNVKEFPYDR